MIHWWLAGLVHPADPMAEATAEPDRVTCPACVSIGRTPRQVGDAVRALP